jgi:hypothetical protein
MKIQHLKTSAFHPRTNGKSEYYNGQLDSILTKLGGNENTDRTISFLKLSGLPESAVKMSARDLHSNYSMVLTLVNLVTQHHFCSGT